IFGQRTAVSHFDLRGALAVLAIRFARPIASDSHNRAMSSSCFLCNRLFICLASFRQFSASPRYSNPFRIAFPQVAHFVWATLTGLWLAGLDQRNNTLKIQTEARPVAPSHRARMRATRPAQWICARAAVTTAIAPCTE